MSTPEIVLTVCAIGALFAWGFFVAQYDRVQWFSSSEGRNLMATSVSILILIVTVCLNRLATLENFSYWSMSVAMLLITATGIWRSYLLRKAQSNSKKEKRK